MSQYLNPIPAISIKNRTSPRDVRSLLELLPGPTLLVDWQTHRILHANAQAIELTAFTRTELTNMELEALFPSLAQANPLCETMDSTTRCDLLLSRHGGAKINVQVISTPLTQPGNQALLGIEPVTHRQHRQAEQQRQAQSWQALQNLALSHSRSEIEPALNAVLQAGSILTSATLLSIYQANGSAPILQRAYCCGNAQHLPEEIFPQDLINLQMPYLWARGKRPICEIHRRARAANLSYVASAPVGQANALVGLVIAAGEISPPEAILDALQVIAAHITSILQNHSLINNLCSALEENRRAMTISSSVRDSVLDGVILVTPDLHIMQMNPSAEMLLGYASREAHGEPLEHILIGAESLAPQLMTMQHNPYQHDLGSITLYRRDGRSFLAQMRSKAVLLDDQLYCWAILIEDLSQEEMYRLRAQQLEQRALLGELTAVFAHEVRNPINNISTGLQLMALNLPQGDPQSDLIERLQQDCDRLAELMKSVLAYARPVEYKMTPLNIGQLLKQLLERWHPRLARANIQYSLQNDPDTPSVLGDPRALEQVFTNLFSNAIQAMQPQPGMLTLKIRPAPAGSAHGQGHTDHDYDPVHERSLVEISVSDNGPGISEEIRERIFEPFFTTHANGTGLGLSITKQIITAHHGTIRVTSIPGGTAFHVLLPATNSLQEVEKTL